MQWTASTGDGKLPDGASMKTVQEGFCDERGRGCDLAQKRNPVIVAGQQDHILFRWGLAFRGRAQCEKGGCNFLRAGERKNASSGPSSREQKRAASRGFLAAMNSFSNASTKSVDVPIASCCVILMLAQLMGVSRLVVDISQAIIHPLARKSRIFAVVRIIGN